MIEEKIFPPGMEPLGNSVFNFSCHAGVRCFTDCCRNVDLILYPYDILRLKQALAISSADFLQGYTRVVSGDNPYFPTLKLRLTDTPEQKCPFLVEKGCSVYSDRPSACRTYPLERAVDRNPGKSPSKDYYFLTQHPYCKGHLEQYQITVKQWVRSQRLEDFNVFNELWAVIDSIFQTNPWKGEGAAGNLQQLAFMICYNIDGFRAFVSERRLIDQFRLGKEAKRRIQQEDSELLKFGFEWLRLILTGTSSLVK